MDGQRFDTFAKTVAGGMSRRSVLRLMVGGAAGLVASATARGALAGNSDCTEFCKSVYGPGEERGQCISAAANGEGLCIACGGEDIPCEGACADPEICGAVTPNQCGCVPVTCEQAGAECGAIANTCGGEPIVCTDTCVAPETCSGGGVANQCGSPPPPVICAGCTPAGGFCEGSEEYCSGYCEGSVCSYGEQFCRATGDVCAGGIGAECCVGTCADGCCTCAAPGDSCDADSNCCDGSICASGTCCGTTDAICVSNDDCCGGRCENGRCSQGPAGTPCRTAGDCIWACDTEAWMCACTFDDFCYTDADCCGGATCMPDAGAAPFTGVCG